MIKFLKLVTGDEVVAKIEETENSYTLIWPIKVYQEMVDGESAPRTRLDPYTPHVKGHTVTVSKQSVLYIAEPVPPLMAYYDENILSSLPKVEEKTEEVVEV